MRLGYIKDENGKLVHKWIQEGDEGKDPDVLYHVTPQFGDFVFTDDEHMDEAKKAFLEQMFNTIKNLAKLDEFWLVKREADSASTDAKCMLGWKISFPQLEGYYNWEEAEKINKKLGECCAQANK